MPHFSAIGSGHFPRSHVVRGNAYDMTNDRVDTPTQSMGARKSGFGCRREYRQSH
jgi:hypothetical protein